MNSKQDLLLESISTFFLNNHSNVNTLLEIIEGKYTSLRLIDWFVTNYSKKHNISYNNKEKNDNFKVYTSYKSQLKSYSKKLFDPFNRSERINFYYEKDKYITTTIGQLNFFRWAIQNNIIDYIRHNCKNIEEDMNNSISYVYNKSCDGENKPNRKKRKELSVSATKFLNKDDITILVSFK
jgi:hypothetical protein